MRGRGAGAALLLLGAAACADGPAGPESSALGPVAAEYLDAALDLMESYSINRYEIEWPSFRSATLTDAGAAQSASDTYAAIGRALARLGDDHSFFRPPGRPSQLAAPATIGPMATLLTAAVGYVSVPAFSGGGPEADALATDYHRLIEGLDTLGVCGWVVDLRGNTGGNMWPMIAGIGPILGEGTPGFFVDPDSVVDAWFYEDGASGYSAFPAASAGVPYEPPDPGRPVAVLTDSRTASSGEGTAIAFRGRPATRSFGRPTWGVSTANASFPLSDGAVIVLTVSTMADRTGALYGEEVVPDEDVPGPRTGDPDTDYPLRSAVTWLQTQSPCG